MVAMSYYSEWISVPISPLVTRSPEGAPNEDLVQPKVAPDPRDSSCLSFPENVLSWYGIRKSESPPADSAGRVGTAE